MEQLSLLPVDALYKSRAQQINEWMVGGPLPVEK